LCPIFSNTFFFFTSFWVELRNAWASKYWCNYIKISMGVQGD
jgi:hypothetical protein